MLRYTETFISWIIQSSLKPLCCRCNCRIQNIYHHVSWKRSNTLTSHWISLISHRRWTDLMLFKWFFNFLQMLKKTNIVGDLCALWAIPLRTFTTRVSSLREYVCPETGKHASNPIFWAILLSASLHFSWSPSKSSRKLACVPVYLWNQEASTEK